MYKRKKVKKESMFIEVSFRQQLNDQLKNSAL